MRTAVKLILLFLISAAAVYAQAASSADNKVDGFTRKNNAKHAQNPEGLSFTVRLKDNRKQFQQGETITVELSFSTSKPNTYILDAATYDRSGRLDSDEFVLDRDDEVVDPLYDYFHAEYGGFVGGGLRSIPDLTDKPYIIVADLNEWMRFDKPGQYRLYVVSSRVGRRGGPSNVFSNDPLTVVSNVIQFEIVPADKKWAARELSQALVTLSENGPNRRPACRTIRFLGTAAAVVEMRKRFRDDDSDCEWQYKFGLIGSPYRDLVLREMETGISSSDQAITSHYLNTLALLEFKRQAPPPPPYPEDNDEQFKLWQKQMQRRRVALDEVRLNYLRQLVMAIPQKQGSARATSLQTLLDHYSELGPKDAAQWPALLALIPEVFSRLPLDAQIRMLTYQWRPIASAAMLPVLRSILKNGDPKYPLVELRSIALRRLNELAPDEGRRLILDELRRLEPHVNQTVLRSLPDETLPELDSVLATNLEQTRGPNSKGDTEVVSDLVERYATAAILPRVRTFYEEPGAGRWACNPQASMIAYFVRVDPLFAEESLRKAVAARGEGLSRCYPSVLAWVARLRMSAEVEEIAIDALEDNEPEVVLHAAILLGEHGSADAEKALWQRMEKLHEAMQDRDMSKQNPETPSNGDNEGRGQIEQGLITALSTGRAWLLDPEKLKRLRDLCVTDRGRKDVDQLIHNWNHSIYVAVGPIDGEPNSISVAQYSPKSLDALKEKVLQFPKGTSFSWSAARPRGDDSKAQEVFQQIKTFLEEHGMKLELPPEP